MPIDPVSELLSKPIRLERTQTPELSGVAIERQNTVTEYTPSQKLPYMTYDQLMAGANDIYSPSDFATVGNKIRDNVVKAIESRFPVVGDKYTLKVENVHYEKPKMTSIKEEKEVLLSDGSLNDRLKGTWVLYDNETGKEVSRKNATLLNVPRMTSRGTFIRNGSEIGLKHMFRLRSGVYTHIKNNGRVSAHINPEQTTGQQMSVEMEPSTGVFSISRGTRTYGLLPMLMAAGVPEDTIKASMGEELYKANYDKYGKMMAADNKQLAEYRQVWEENMAPIKLDAETTESTLGKAFSKMEPDVLLRASNRILQVSRTMSDNDTDDRDSLRYQRVMGPADYIPERIVRDGGGLLRKLFNTVTRSGNLDAVATGAFQPHVDSVFLDDKHAGYIDGSSPMESLDFANMISRIGEGGIGSLRAAPAETRGVNDSYLGFIDPIRCYSRNHQIMTTEGWKNIADVTMEDKVACLINGAVEYHSPDAVHAYDYNQDLYCYSAKAVAYEVTGNHRMWVCKVAHKGGQKKRGGYQKEYKPSFMFETAEDMHNTNRRVMTGGHAPYTGCWESRGSADDFNYECYGISQVDWAAFMGWYLAEGSTLIKNDKGQADRNSAVSISQTKAVHPKDYEDICQLLSRLPWSFKASKQERALCIKSHELAQYLRRFGYCNDKYIPAQLFDMSVEARKAFMDAMMRGDGRQPQGNEGWVYTTTSEKLARGVERMLFDLGHCVTTHMYEDKRTDWYLPVYEVRATVSKQGWLIKNGREVTEREERSDYYKMKPCDGKVFCVTVPGGMVYTRIQGHKGFWCGNSPESLKVGLDIYMTHGIMKDSSGKLYNRFKDKSGKPVVVPMDVTAKSIVATPEFWDPKGNPDEFIPAMYQGKGIEYVKRKDVDFYVDNSNTMMSIGAGMIPLIGGIRSNRTLMGCLHPDTLLAAIRDNKPVHISAFDLWVTFSDHTWGVPSLDDDNSSIIYRQIKKVVRHDLNDFNDSRLTVVNMRIVDDDDVGGLVCICTMDHKWLVRVCTKTEQEQLLTTRDIMKTLEDGIKVYAPAVGYPHKFSFGSLYGKSLSEVGYWKELSVIGVLNTDEFKEHYVIDIDVDDHVYMLANGMFTHNSKYGNQAVPLQSPEAPLVQRKMVNNDGTETTTEKLISRQLGAKYSPVRGKVLKVDADSITIAGADGQKHTVDLYNEYPANQKGFIHNTALVQPGDKVDENQLLAKSNYTDDEGTAALGANLRVAFLSARNAGTFEDSITISESAAKKLASTQLYKLRGDTSDDIEYNKGRYLSLFKDDFTPEQLDKIGDDGLPKPGVTFNYGDPVYLGVQTRDIGVHGLAKNAAVPYVTRWEHSAPGTVTNVVQGKKHLTVYTKAVTPMEVGDKLCFDKETEILTDKGWKFFKDLDDTERVLTLDLKTGDTWLTAYSEKHKYKLHGKMYHLKTNSLDICTTPDHEHIVSVSTTAQYTVTRNSKQIFGKYLFHIVGQDVTNEYNFKPSQTPETVEQWIDYDDYVYCVTVPYTHTVFVRRNGKTVWSGNSSRWGAKGTVGEILPDEEMPRDQSGNSFDILQSPLGLPSRLNTSMLAELSLAKIARKHGIKYQLPDFLDESIIDFVDRELKKYGEEPDEDLYDPVTGKTIPQIQTGELFFYKLKHMAELKERGRSTGTYSAEDIPLKGEGAARRLGGMESSAVFSGGGMEVLRDAKIVRGQRNDDFWRDYRAGKYPETPGFPLVHQKFFAHLKAAGVNLEDKGDRVHLYGATDSDLRELTGNRKVTKAATFESKNMQPIQGGLFDPTIFGADGDQWGYVDLPEPVLNPIMFKTVGAVLGWKDKELTEYLEGSRSLNGKFGTQNLMETLNSVDMKKEVARAKQVLKADSTTLEQRDMARKRIRAMEPMLREGKTPAEFFFTRMPILPPRFRPVTAMSNGVGIAADANFLYKRMMDAADDLRQAKEMLPEEMQLDARKQLYETVNAVTGLTPTDDPKLEAKGVAGVLKWAFGKGSPKCYDPETEILTERGWIKFPEYVAMQDYDLPVMTYDRHKQEFVWQKPQRILSRNYKGRLIHTVTSDIDTCVTEDHMHYMSKRSDNPDICGPLGKVEASKLLAPGSHYLCMTVYVSRDRELDVDAILNEDIDIRCFKDVYRCAATSMVTINGEASKAVDYDGPVYCVTVPNGLIVTRRNGRTIVSGNCGSLHRKVFGANLDLGSLGTITPDNTLTIDQVGIPERSAWKMFEPFVVRRLVQQGASVIDAMRGVLDQSDEARRALVDVMKERPVLLNRAPTLWRYGIQGQYPVLVEGNAIRVNPNICKLYNADFDGDSVRTSIKIAFSNDFSKIALDKSQNDDILYSIQQPNKEDNMLKKEAKVVMGNVRCAICDVPRIEESVKQISATVTEWDVPAGVFTECLDRTTGEKVLAPVTKLSLHKDVNMYDVHMATYGAYKHIVTCSKEDTLLTYKDGEIVITDASTAQGAVVPKAKATDMGMDPEYCAKYIKLDKQYALSYDMGVFIGMMVGDGWVDSQDGTWVAAECLQIQEWLVSKLNASNSFIDGNKGTHIYEYDTERFGNDKAHRVWCSIPRHTARALKEKIGTGAYNKRIPLESMAGSRAHRIGVLLGLIATDGSVNYSENPAKGKKSSQKSILFHTTSQYLRDNIIDLCFSLGIKATATAYRGQNSLADCYAVNLSVRDTVALYNSDPRFRMIADSDEKAMKAMAAEVVSDEKPDSYDIVPYPKHISILLSLVNDGRFPATEMNRYKNQGFISRDFAKEFVSRLKTFDYNNYSENRGKKADRPGYTPERAKELAEDWIRLVENEDVQWEVVTDIQSIGKMDAWDVTVPGPLTFTLGSGTFVQDSMTTHVPVSKEAVKAIDEKMLPSRNLLSPIDAKAHFIPVAEFAQGLYLASRTRNEAPIRFRTKEEMMEALNKGEIKIDTPVVIG